MILDIEYIANRAVPLLTVLLWKLQLLISDPEHSSMDHNHRLIYQAVFYLLNKASNRSNAVTCYLLSVDQEFSDIHYNGESTTI